MDKITAQDFEEALRGCLLNDDAGMLQMALCEVLDDDDAPGIAQVQNFAEADLLTNDAGVVVTLTDGTQFQLTIQRSK